MPDVNPFSFFFPKSTQRDWTFGFEPRVLFKCLIPTRFWIVTYSTTRVSSPNFESDTFGNHWYKYCSMARAQCHPASHAGSQNERSDMLGYKCRVHATSVRSHSWVPSHSCRTPQLYPQLNNHRRLTTVKGLQHKIWKEILKRFTLSWSLY